MDESLSKALISVVTVIVTTLVFNLVLDWKFKKQRAMLSYLNPFTPRHGIDPAMAATLTPVSRLIMSRRQLTKDVLSYFVNDMRDMWDDANLIRHIENSLRRLDVTEVFWVKQSLIVAAERDALEGSKIRYDVASSVFMRETGTSRLIAANISSIPTRTDTNSLMLLANHLPERFRSSHEPLPHLAAQIEALNYCRNEDYEPGRLGMLAPIILRHPEHPIDVARFCIERGLHNFSDERFVEYRSMGAVREGML